jgi:hypothetical protein
MFQTKVIEKKSKNTFCVQQLFSKKRSVYEIKWKNSLQPTTNDNMANARCILDT